MLEVHNDGKSVVVDGSREEMERDVQAMHEYGLWATMEKQTDERGLHSGTGAAAVQSRPSPASRPTCCGRWPPSWSSCCATRRPCRATSRRPARGAAGLLRPDDRARGPGARPAVPHGVPRRRGGRRRVPPLHRGRLRDGKAAAAVAIIDDPRGGRPARRARRGRPGHRRRARPGAARDLAEVVHRHAARAGHPARGRGGRRGLLAGAARRRPARAGHDIYEWLGYLQETLVDALTR